MPTRRPVPRLPLAILRALLPLAERDEVLADLASEYATRSRQRGPARARRWIWGQVARSLPSLAARTWWRGWSGFEPAASEMKPGGPTVEQLIIDARHAARRLVRRPLYSAIAIVTLAIGIGGTAAILAIARSVLVEHLPYRDEARLAAFWAPFDWTQEEFAWLRGRVPGFDRVAQYQPYDATLEVGDAPARLVSGTASSTELFDVLGARPLLGRTFEPQDDAPGAPEAVVLSYGLWREIGGSDAIVGRQIRLGGASHTVVGVMPRGFWFPSPASRIWISQPVDPGQRTGNYALVGRLAAGSGPDAMANHVAQLTRMLGERFTYPEQWDKTRSAWIRPLRAVLVGGMRPALVATLVAMGMILLIACANVAALMLGQVEGRATELAVRSALGARRRRIMAQLTTEALMLGLASGAVGAGVAGASLQLLVDSLPLGAWGVTARLDWRIFGTAMTVAVLAALGISLVPSLSLWRGRLRGALGTARTAGVGARGARLEGGLVVAEVALALLVSCGAGLVMRSVSHLYAIDPGVDVARIGVADVVLPSDLTTVRRKQVLGELVAGIRALPGIEHAAVVQHLPLRGSAWSSGVTIDGTPDLPATTTFVRLVSADYFATMGVPVMAGRAFEATDELVAPGDSSGFPIVVNEAFVRKYLPGEAPIGRRVGSGLGRAMGRIIGVVRNVAEAELTADPAPARYLLLQSLPLTPSGQTIVFRAAGAPRTLLPMLRGEIPRLAPRIAVDRLTTMQDVVALAAGPARQVIALVVVLAGLALVLGALGIYGVISHLVARRRRDWSVRIALGMSPSRVVAGVVRSGARLVVAGIVLGLVLFLALARLLGSLLYGVGATDPASIAGASIVLLSIGAVAALVPALRASRTDPADVLREG
jgi:putative ABC transport system permease protein